MLAAHARKLFSYMHNNLQVDTSAEGSGAGPAAPATPAANHATALRMFGVMNEAVRERRRLRNGPLFAPVRKAVTHKSADGAFAVIDFADSDGVPHHRGSDVVRVLLPRDAASALALQQQYFVEVERLGLAQLATPHGTAWGWSNLFEALGWPAEGVEPARVCRFIEAVHADAPDHRTPVFRPVSPRVYSVCGTEPEQLRILVSCPRDGRTHYGFSRLLDAETSPVWLACAPGRRFPLPPPHANLLMVAAGTGISPFVSLVDQIGAQPGTYTLIHQTRSPDAFTVNLEAWRRFTRRNAGAMVMGYLSGSSTSGSTPERIVISGGEITERVNVESDSKAYFFLCDATLARLRAISRPADNLAYCCGGTHSTVSPLRHLLSEQGWQYEFTAHAHSIEPRVSPRARLFKAADKLIDAEQLIDLHPGGTAIIDQLMPLMQSSPDRDGPAASPPELTDLFIDLHPDPDNMRRLLHTPSDDEFQSFANVLEQEAEQGVVLDEVAHQYVAAALAFPNKLKLVKVALELESRALDDHLTALSAGVGSSDEALSASAAKATRCLQNCEDLLPLLTAEDAARAVIADRIQAARELLASPTWVFDARTGRRSKQTEPAAASEASRLGYQARWVNHLLVVTLTGRLDGETSQSFQDRLLRDLGQGHGRVVLDLSGLIFISSMGLRSVLIAAKRARVVLCGLSPFVARIIELGGIGSVARIADRLEQAIELATD